MHKQKIKAFTLVELIVVITILAILWTIAFISLQWYSADARDSVRTSDLSVMKSWLELYNLDAWSYPQPSDTIIITYSWATAWLQWTFWETVKTNVSKLDKVPKDPLTDKEYVYSTTSTRNEYSIAWAFEWETLSYTPPLTPPYQGGGLAQQVEAAWTKTANLKLTWTYNGKVLKVSTGSTTYILAMPSIMSSSGTTVETITTNKTLAYEWYKNLPFQYTGAYNVEWEENLNLVNSGSIVVYAWDLSILSDATSIWINARKTLIENLQQAYNGTTISSIWEISQILNTNTIDQTATEYVWTNLVANDLWWSIKAVTIAPTVTTYSNCTTTTQSWYTIPQLNHGINNQQVTKSVTNWTKTLEVTCENWVLTYWVETTNCENDYIVSNDTCVLDNCSGTMPDNAQLNWTQWTATWSYNTSPWVCKYRCQDGNHTENWWTTCVSDTQSCVISNATASQTWNGSTWWTCTVQSCNSNYTQSGNACNLNTYTVSWSFWANWAWATVSVCGSNVTADWSGNFTTTRNYWSTCNNISATRSGYTCSTSTNWPSSLTSNTTNIAWSCSVAVMTSCKTLYDAWNTTSWTYTIDPDWAWPNASYSVYCDMVNDWWGWTLVMRIFNKSTCNLTTRNACNTSSFNTSTAEFKYSDVDINLIKNGWVWRSENQYITRYWKNCDLNFTSAITNSSTWCAKSYSNLSWNDEVVMAANFWNTYWLSDQCWPCSWNLYFITNHSGWPYIWWNWSRYWWQKQTWYVR